MEHPSYFDNSMPTPSIDALNSLCYNAKADYWDRMPFADFLPANILKAHNPVSGKHVLDIGSGTGIMAEWLAKEGFDVMCIDPAEAMVRRCRAKGLSCIQSTLQNFWCPGKFGLILAVLSLIHVPKRDISEQLTRIHAWLEPEGTFVLALIAGQGEGVKEESLGYPRYFSYYKPEEVIQLTKNKFTCQFETKTKGAISYLVYIFRKIG